VQAPMVCLFPRLLLGKPIGDLVIQSCDTYLTEPEILKMARDWFDAHSPVKHAV
jgi:hypothetical protein